MPYSIEAKHKQWNSLILISFQHLGQCCCCTSHKACCKTVSTLCVSPQSKNLLLVLKATSWGFGSILVLFFLCRDCLISHCSSNVIPILHSLPPTLGHSNKLDIYSSPGPIPPFSMLEICFSASQNSYSAKVTLNGGNGVNAVKRCCRNITI